MSMGKPNLHIVILYIVIFFCLITNIVRAQDSTHVDIMEMLDEEKVHWIGQIPISNKNLKKNSRDWIGNLLFGKKNNTTTIKKPMQAIKINDKETIIIDQGNGTIFLAEEENLSIPKILRKGNRKFSSLVSGCLLPNGDLLFTDSHLNTIYRLTANKKHLEPFNQSELNRPTGIAFSPETGNVWVVETGSHRISLLDENGTRIRTFGERGIGEGQFNYPVSLCITGEGLAYVVDAMNYRIQIFNNEGHFISMFGENGNGTGFLAAPKGIAVDSFGHIYIVDALFHGVQIFDRQGNYLYQFGRQGRNINEFWMPSGITIDNNNNIYVADTYNSRIQIFKLSFSE